jgi:hypothetical protein
MYVPYLKFILFTFIPVSFSSNCTIYPKCPRFEPFYKFLNKQNVRGFKDNMPITECSPQGLFRQFLFDYKPENFKPECLEPLDEPILDKPVFDTIYHIYIILICLITPYLVYCTYLSSITIIKDKCCPIPKTPKDETKDKDKTKHKFFKEPRLPKTRTSTVSQPLKPVTVSQSIELEREIRKLKDVDSMYSKVFRVTKDRSEVNSSVPSAFSGPGVPRSGTRTQSKTELVKYNRILSFQFCKEYFNLIKISWNRLYTSSRLFTKNNLITKVKQLLNEDKLDRSLDPRKFRDQVSDIDYKSIGPIPDTPDSEIKTKPGYKISIGLISATISFIALNASSYLVNPDLNVNTSIESTIDNLEKLAIITTKFNIIKSLLMLYIFIMPFLILKLLLNIQTYIHLVNHLHYIRNEVI